LYNPPMKHARESDTSSVTTKGQVTIPVHIRRLLGLSPRDRVAFLVKDGKVELAAASAQSLSSRTAGALMQYRRKPAPRPRDERDAFEQSVAEEVSGSLEP
jgi:AbrB family looped-hinge helix DNA binding protein